MTTVGDLFADLDGSDSPNSIREIIPDKLDFEPDAIVQYDINNQNTILTNTEMLKNCLRTCEDVVIAAYKVREHVPDLRNPSHAEFWKQQVIPNLKKCVTQDVQARQVLIHAFGAVRDLSIVIHKASDIVRQTGGSARALEIAQKNIPDALQRLDEFIERAHALDSSAINCFVGQTDQLFEIIGPEAANFAKQKAFLRNELNKIYDNQNEIWDKYAEQKGEIVRYEYLISATQRQLSDAKEADQETKQRMLTLNKLVREIDDKIQNIDSGIKDTVTETYKKFGLWRKHKTVTTYQPGENNVREDDKKYYESLILARKSRLCDEQNIDKANAKNIKELLESLAEYKKKHEMALKSVETFSRTFEKRWADLQGQIDSLYKKLEEVDERQKDTESKFGSSGNSLIECLISLENYSKKIQTGATAYSPLVSILKGIKAMVKSDVDLLSGSATDIFLAGNRLTKFVGFLSNYSVNSLDVLELCDEYRQLSIKEN